MDEQDLQLSTLGWLGFTADAAAPVLTVLIFWAGHSRGRKARG